MTVTRLLPALAAALLATGCKGEGGSKQDPAPKAGDPAAAEPGAAAPKRAPSRGPERAVYSLVDNRLAAHLHRGGGLVLPGGSAGFAKYVRFGNTEKGKGSWELRATEGDVKVAKMTGTSARVDVPLTAAELAGAPVVRIRAYSAEPRPVSLRVNGNADINGQLAAGWSTLELAVPAGQLKEGDNQLLLFVRGAGLPIEWIQVGGEPPGDAPVRFYDRSAKTLLIPDGGAMTWYAFVPDKGRVTADLSDAACEVAVRATGEDGQTVEGTLSGLGSAVDLAALSGQAARLTLEAKGCPEAALANAALVVPGEPVAAPPRGAPPKYIVFIIMDSLRADRVKLFNPKARAEIPTLEKLAEESAVFLQSYVQGNESRVSHASTWTSLYPLKHSMIGSKEKLDKKWTTIDEVAKRAGMFTAGATGNGYVDPGRWGFGEKWDKYSNHIHEQAGLKAEDILDKGWSFVANRKEPWFLYLGFIDTHVSWRAKQPWAEQYDPGYTGRFAETFSGEDAAKASQGKITMTEREIEHVRALYDSNVSYQDQQLGILIDKLKAAGIWDQTMLILTADHGDEQWEDGRVGHGSSVRDMLVHVPLIVRYPPMLPGGPVAEGADVLDVVPTIADALGVPTDPEWQGESLIPLAGGAGRGYPRMSFTSMYEDAHGVRIAHWKARLQGTGAPRLYDLASDPDEMKDVWGQDDAAIGARALLDPAWLFRAFNLEWRKSQWGNAANVTARFAADLGE